MPKKPNVTARLLHELIHNPELKQQPVDSDGLDDHIEALRLWQSQRLSSTYADLLDDRRFSQACAFFLSDIYNARDFAQRDEDVLRIHTTLSKVLPALTLRLLTEAIDLAKLTYDLDNRLASALLSIDGFPITPEKYATAYLLCDNFAVRVEQIERIVNLMKTIADGVKLPLVGTAVRLARYPAVKAGYSQLYDFVTRGYAAFHSLRSPQIFVHTIEKRERAILDNIYASKPEPFDVI
jgi:hypothetical protein